MVRVTVHLPVVELDGANGLDCWEAGQTFPSQATIAAVLSVFIEPLRDRRWRDRTMSLCFKSRGRFLQCVAKVVVRESRQDHAQGIGLVVQGRRARREYALAG